MGKVSRPPKGIAVAEPQFNWDVWKVPTTPSISSWKVGHGCRLIAEFGVGLSTEVEE